MKNPFEVGQDVVRTGLMSAKTTGRRGEVIEVKGQKVRVLWMWERDASMVRKKSGALGVRVWHEVTEIKQVIKR